MRVLHVVDTLHPGGAEQLVLTTVRNLHRGRFEPLVAVLGPPFDLKVEIEAAGVPVIALSDRGPSDWRCALAQLVRVLRRYHIDVMHTHLRFSNVIGRLAAAVSRTPIVVTTLHSLDYTYWPPTRLAGRLWKRLDLITARTINDSFIAVSEAVRTDYARHFGLRRIALVYNYLDVAALRSALPVSLVARRALGLAEADFILSTVGRLAPEKGHEYLLRATAEVVKMVPAARLVLVGTGPEEGTLRALAQSLGISGRITFLNKRRDVPTLLAASDLFVFPSTREALGIALLEGMAAGLPVIASRVDGILEVVHDGVDGVLVPPADPVALAAAVVRLHGDMAWRQALGQEARRSVERRFGLETGLRAVETMYTELARRAGIQVGVPQ